MLLFHLPGYYLIGIVVWMLAGVAALYGLLKLRRRRGAGVIPNLLLSLWMLLAVLTAVEVGFALFYDTTDSFNMTNVSRRWFDVHVEASKRALRLQSGEHVLYRDDREFPTTLEDRQTHVLFIGDSFAFGHGVTDVGDRFSNRVRDGLNESAGDDYVVSNLAWPGTDLHWVEEVTFQLLDDGHRVNELVYVVCLNDIETFHERHRTYYLNMGRNDPGFFLFRYTYFFNLLYFRAKQFTMPEVRGYYSFVEEYYRTEPWERMQRKLEDLSQLCDEYGARLHVVVFPFLHDRDGDYDFLDAHRAIVEFCDEAEIPALDLEPVLTPHADRGLTVNPFDAHPNSRAHQLAGDAILDHLRSTPRTAATAEVRQTAR